MKKNNALAHKLWVILFLVVLSAHANAAIRYVGPAGSDAGNDCLSFGSPCATITHAAGQADAGDTILLDSASYSQTALINQSVTLNGSGATLEGAIRLAANDITLSNLTISGGATVLGETAGIYIDGGSSGHQISNIDLQGTGLPAARAIIFGANASDISISDSQINGWTSGIYINPSPNANITISGNTISNNVAGIGGDNYSDVTISDNDFIDNDEGIGYSGTAAGPAIVDNNFSGNTVIVQSYGDAQLDVEAIAANNTLGSNVLNLTQGSAYSSIQAGIDAANDDDVLQASEGTFTEDLNLANTSGLTLLGAQAGVTAGVDGVRDASSTSAESIIDGTFSFGGGSPTTFDLTVDGFRLENTSMAGARIGGALTLRNLIVDSVTGVYFVSTVGTFTEHQLILSDSTISGARAFSAENGQLTSVDISNNIFNQPAASLISASALDGVVSLTGNVFNGPRGVNILTNDNLIANNVFNVGGGQRGIDLYEVTGNTITGNIFNADDAVGMVVVAGGRNEAELLNTISNNQFLGDSADGIVNSLSKPVDASCNWWGDDSGAGGEGPGSGTPVSENVNTIPWNLEPSGQCFGANPDLMLQVGPGLPPGVPEGAGWDHFTAQLTNDGDLVPENVVLWIEVDGIADADVVGGLTVELFDGSNWGSLGWGGASAWNISRDAWFIGRGPTEVVGFEIPAGYDETLPLRVNWPNGTYSATISIESLDSADGAGLPGERNYLTQTEALLVQTEAVANVYVDSGFAGSSNGDALVFTMPDGSPVNVTFGLDAFANPYAGLAAVAEDGTVQVASGDFFDLNDGQPLELETDGVTFTTDPADPATLRYGFTDFFPVIEVFAENTTVEYFNLVRDNGGEGAQAIAIRKAGSTVSNLTISGSNNTNIAAITLDHGLPGEGYSSQVDNVLITGNSISGDFLWGFGVATRSATGAILGAEITDNLVDGTDNGIFLFNSGGTETGIQNIVYTGNTHSNLGGSTLLFQNLDVLDPAQFVANNSFDRWARASSDGRVFLSIQSAINAATDGDTVVASAGTFAESLSISGKSDLTLLGAQAGVSPLNGRSAGDAAETVIDGQGGIRTIQLGAGASGLIIDGFSITSTAGTTQGVAEITPLAGTTVRNNFIYGYPASLAVSISAGSTGSLVESNHITDVYAGVYLSTNAGSLTVAGNRIENLSGSGGDQGSAIVLEGNHLDVSVIGNELLNNAHGVFLFTGFGDDLDGTLVSNNSIVGNAVGITSNRTTTLDASCNWWGDESGPSGVAGGDGDSVTDNVNFQPWRVAEGGDCIGFTSPVVRVSDGAVFGSFTDAIADAGTVDGDTLMGTEAVYQESFTVNKALTITGVGSATVIDGGMASSNGISIPGNQTDVTISNLRVQNFSGTCIRGGVGNNNTLIDTVEVANCDGPGAGGGIYFDGPVDNITITNSTITNANWRSIVIWNGFKTNITITDNIVTGNGGLCCGIELQDGTASGVTITGNVVTGHGDSGIGLTGLTGGAGPNLIANNTVTDNGRFGIEIKNPNGTVGADESADGAIVVRDNTVALTEPVADLRDLAGIAVFRRVVLPGNVDIPTGVIVRDNTVTGYRQDNMDSFSDGFGIVVEGTQMRVFDNSLEDNDVGLQRQSGHQPYPGDGDQGNLDDDYFGRGNSPVVCALIGTNQFTNNAVDSRDVQQPGAEGPDPRVNNIDNGAFHCGIQSAIDAESTLAGHTLVVDGGSYEELVRVDKAINLVGDPDGLDRPLITFSGSVASGEETLVRVLSEDVTIDGFELVVDQTFIGEAIRTEGNATGLVVRNNRISAVPSNPNSIVPFGIRNAIAVNTIGRPGMVGGGFGPVLIENNEILALPTGVGIGGFFRAGVAMDTVNGTLSGNDVLAITHDAIIRFVAGGNLVVHDNDFRGGGLQFNEFNATGPAVISENRFIPDAGLVASLGGTQSSLRLQNNPRGIETTVTGNDFSGHSTAIRAENYPALSIDGNGFVPGADELYQHIVVSNRVNASNYIAPLEIDIAIDGNAFFGGNEPGTALVFDNLNCCEDVGSGNTTASFGELRVGGNAANEFDGGLGQYIVLDDSSGLVDFGLAQSEAQPFFADVNAIGNIWAGVAGADQNEAERAATRARIVDNRDNDDLGNVILDFLGASVEGTTSVQGIGAPVLAVAGVSVEASQNGTSLDATTSQTGGAYVLVDLPEGNVDISAALSGFATASQSVSLSEGGSILGVDFLLDSSVDAGFSASAEGQPLDGQRFFADREVNDVNLSVTRTDGGGEVDFYVSLTVFDSQGNEIDYITQGLFSTATLIELDGLLGEGNNFTLPGNASFDLLSDATLEVGPNADQLDVATLSFRLIDGRFGESGSRIVHAATNFAVTIDPVPSISLLGLDTSTLTVEFSTEVLASASGYEGLTPAQVAATAVDAASKQDFLLTFFDFDAAVLALVEEWGDVAIDGSDTELSVTFNPGLFEKSYALDLGNTGATRIDSAWAGTELFETVSGKAINGPTEPAYKLEFTVPYSDTTGVDYSAPVTTLFVAADKPIIRPFAPGIESGTSTSDPVVIDFATGSYATGLVAEYSRNGGDPVAYGSGDELTAAGSYELTVTNVSNPNVEPNASTTIRFTIEGELEIRIEGPALAPLAEQVFYAVTLENNQATDPGENVEARVTVTRPGIEVGDLLLEFCLDSEAAGTPGNCAQWIELDLVQDGDSLTASYGPAGGFEVEGGYEATTFFRAEFTRAGNYAAEVSVSGVDSGDLLAADQLTVTVTELSFEIEAGVAANVDDSEAGFAYYTAELANLGDELPELVRLYIEVRDADGQIVDNANAFEFWNELAESWDSLAYDGDEQRWAFGPASGFVIDEDYFAATAVRADFPNGIYDLVITVETADRDADPIWTYGLFERQIAVISEPVELDFELLRGVTAPQTPPRWDYFTAILSNTGGNTPDNVVLYVAVDDTDFAAGDQLQFWNGEAWSNFGYDADRDAWFLGRDGAGGVSGFPIEAGEVFPIEIRVNFLPAEYDFTITVESIDDSLVGVGGVYAEFAETAEVLPTPATISFVAADLVQVFDGNEKSVAVTTEPEAELDVAFSFDPAPPVDAGSYLVEAEITDPYFVGSASATLVIEPAEATVEISNLLQVFDGDPKPVTVTTNPADLNVSVTYDGETTVPVDAGSYLVEVEIDENNYVGSATATLVIEPAVADILIEDLVQTFDGDPKPVTVTTVPSGLTVIVTYDGNSMAPTDAGEYLVEVTVDEANYVGSDSATLVIEQATQQIDFAALPDRTADDSPFMLSATASSGLAVEFALISGPATVDGNEVTLTGDLGEVVIEATQPGDDNWLPADAVQQSFEVTAGAAANIEAASAIVITGQAGEPVAAEDLPVVLVTDSFGNAVAGVTVGFEVVSGGGSLSGAVGQTDADGQFHLGGWTLGTAASQVVEASAPGLDGSPVAFTAEVGAVADVQISIDDNRETIEVGERNTYVIVVSNGGPSNVDEATVSVPLPAELDASSADWSCIPANNASCSASGQGEIDDSVTLPAGSSLVYILEADVLLGPTQTIVVNASIELGGEVTPVDPAALEASVVTQVIVTEDRIFRDRFEQDGNTPTGSAAERAQLQGFLQLPESRATMGSVETLLSGRDRDNGTVFRAVIVQAADQSRIRLSLRARSGEWAHSNWQRLEAEDRYLAFDFDADSGLVILAGEQLELLVTQSRAVRSYQRLQTHPSVQLIQ